MNKNFGKNDEVFFFNTYNAHENLLRSNRPGLMKRHTSCENVLTSTNTVKKSENIFKMLPNVWEKKSQQIANEIITK